MKCVFCERQAEFRCRWPEEKPTEVRHGRIKSGDTFITQGRKRLPILAVNRFHRTLADKIFPWRRRQVLITMYGVNYGRDKYFVFYRYGVQKVRVLRPGVCGNAVCELHVREVGDNTHYCRDHWTAWEGMLSAGEAAEVASCR